MLPLLSGLLSLSPTRQPAPLSLLPSSSARTRARPPLLSSSPLKVLLPIATGSEEIETACISDTLTRAGADVTVASVGGAREVVMSRGLTILADCLLDACLDSTYDAIAIPGGLGGARCLGESKELISLLSAQADAGRIVAAVCAAPALVLAPHSLCPKLATCYPAEPFKQALPLEWMDSKVVVDGNVITSQGPGTSLQFSLKIVEQLYGKEKAEQLAEEMLTELA